MPNSVEPPGLALISSESRYLTSLHVFAKDLELEADKIDTNHQRIKDLELGVDKINSHDQNVHVKIIAVLKLLTLREQHVLVQFWSPHVVGNQQLLTTIDQPFGLGLMDERLCTYRQDSKRSYFVMNKDKEEEDRSPTTRAFRQGLPEWTPDVANYLPKHFQQQECAIRCNLHGYLALPVFYSNSRLCVGVLELLTSLKHMSYAYEVQQLHNALETVELRTQQAFDCPILNVSKKQ
ncbi:hypothetical protein M8C21_018915 [Ambrosia artemisiifolia]|uniref:Uncharacterized protein n=1 Tax=Ambrosia artemisiifolia TaxID=4212 RepID=A0AAD5D879_AMBAR|nr:hypothetical protein M8C21_018915 [Ambrosia artemisiifolia]